MISDSGTARVSGLTFSGGTGLGLTSLPPIPGVGLTHGGAILTGGNLTVTFVENAGSAVLVNDEVMNVIRSTFARNLGGILSRKSLIVSNSTFVGNTASGAIRSATPIAASISRSTFVGNSFGILADGPVTLRNSILAHNFSNCSGFGAITDGGGNFYWPFSLCPGTLVDPLLDPAGLADNGGPTMTVALTPESPAVDAAVVPCFGTDQRGVVRPQGPACDSGAFELEQAASPDELIQDARDEIAVLADGDDAEVADKAEDARDKLNVALAELGKTPPDGVGALGALESAAGELEAMVEDGLLSPPSGEDLLDTLAEAGRLLATDAIDAADGGDASKLDEANGALAQGDALRDDGRYKDAIAKYKDAYSIGRERLSRPGASEEPDGVCPRAPPVDGEPVLTGLAWFREPCYKWRVSPGSAWAETGGTATAAR